MLTDVIGQLRAQEHLAEPSLAQELLFNSKVLTKPVSHHAADAIGALAVAGQPLRTMRDAFASATRLERELSGQGAHPYRRGDALCWGEGLAMCQERAR